jgi:hypothetical protein
MDLADGAGDTATRAKGSGICNNRRDGSRSENRDEKRKTGESRRIQRGLQGRRKRCSKRIGWMYLREIFSSELLILRKHLHFSELTLLSTL